MNFRYTVFSNAGASVQLRHFDEEISDSKQIYIGLCADFRIEDGLIV